MTASQLLYRRRGSECRPAQATIVFHKTKKEAERDGCPRFFFLGADQAMADVSTGMRDYMARIARHSLHSPGLFVFLVCFLFFFFFFFVCFFFCTWWQHENALLNSDTVTFDRPTQKGLAAQEKHKGSS